MKHLFYGRYEQAILVQALKNYRDSLPDGIMWEVTNTLLMDVREHR